MLMIMMVMMMIIMTINNVMAMRKKTIGDIINESRIKVILNFNRLLESHTPEKDV